MGKMSQRIAYGTTTIALLLALFGIDAAVGRWAAGNNEALAELVGPSPERGPLTDLLQRGSVLPLFFVVVMLKGAGELMGLLRSAGIFPHAVLAYVAVAAIFLAPWFSAGGWLGSDVHAVEGLLWPIVLLAFTGLACAGAQLLRRNPAGTLKDVSGTLLPVVYLGFLPSFAMQIRCGADTPGQQGVWLLLITILVAKGSDIGAYFIGSMVGRHKLMPSVSPGKSVEGTIGGLASSVVVALLFALALPAASGLGASAAVVGVMSEITAFFGAGVNVGRLVWQSIIFGLCLSAIGQLGDLFESCLKRDAGIKDSGMIMPQFGGMLDVIDSAIFAMPVGWVLLTRVWPVG